MSLNKFFYSIAAMLLLIGAFIFACPFFITPEIIYPVRVDSLYVRFESEHSRSLNHDSLAIQSPAFFNPSSLGMKYENFDVQSPGGITLSGWYVSAEDADANTILLLHDLSQSKINYLNMMKQMHDRGLNVCAIDMRAHGTSGGDEFSPGIIAVSDIKNVVDALIKKTETNHVAIFGAGIGAAVAIQVASVDDRIEALIAQSPFDNFSDYVDRYVKRKWNYMGFFLHVVLNRKLEKQLQYEVKALDLSAVVKYVKTPTLFICGSNDEISLPSETYAVYDSSGSKEKNLILVKKAMHNNIEQTGGADYYNAIAQFIANVIPKKMKDTRYKKLAMQ